MSRTEKTTFCQKWSECLFVCPSTCENYLRTELLYRYLSEVKSFFLCWFAVLSMLHEIENVTNIKVELMFPLNDASTCTLFLMSWVCDLKSQLWRKFRAFFSLSLSPTNNSYFTYFIASTLSNIEWAKKRMNHNIKFTIHLKIDAQVCFKSFYIFLIYCKREFWERKKTHAFK